MPQLKQASKQKRGTKAAVSALGAAGLTFSLLGSATASAVPTADVAQTMARIFEVIDVSFRAMFNRGRPFLKLTGPY